MTPLACLLAALLALPAPALPSTRIASSHPRSLAEASVAAAGHAAQAHPDSVPPAAYGGMRWRLVGPFRAGWATVAAGVPGKPNTFYFGSAGGGVWKTTDAGRTWQGLMQHQAASSIGALAVAPSDPDVIYAGTGQPTIRYDAMAGTVCTGRTTGGRRGSTWGWTPPGISAASWSTHGIRTGCWSAPWGTSSDPTPSAAST